MSYLWNHQLLSGTTHKSRRVSGILCPGSELFATLPYCTYVLHHYMKRFEIEVVVGAKVSYNLAEGYSC